MNKIAPDHLAREAVVYIRQSTQDQLRHNHESRRRQYGLADRARGLGWDEPVVIDEDLGPLWSGNIAAGLRSAAGGERELRADAYCHRHRHGWTGARRFCTANRPCSGRCWARSQAAAVRTARFRHGQRQRFRERDGARLLPGFRDRFYPLPSVA